MTTTDRWESGILAWSCFQTQQDKTERTKILFWEARFEEREGKSSHPATVPVTSMTLYDWQTHEVRSVTQTAQGCSYGSTKLWMFRLLRYLKGKPRKEDSTKITIKPVHIYGDTREVGHTFLTLVRLYVENERGWPSVWLLIFLNL